MRTAATACDCPVERDAIGAIDAALAGITMRRDDLEWHDLELTAGEHVVAQSQRTLFTRDVSILKQWVGFDDAAIRDGRQVPSVVDYAGLPSVAALADAKVSAADRRAHLDTIQRAFVFGDSAVVEAYRDLLNWHASPFRVNVMAFGRVVLHAGTRLDITGDPAVVMMDELIFRGGQLFIGCESRIAIRSMVGRGGAATGER